MNSSRATYILLKGPVAADKVVCHSCDNPACCNPSHLWVGSQADNLRDCRSKGRARGMFSEKVGYAHPRHTAKLTPEKVAEARRRYLGGETQTALAREFGVHPGTISRAVRGELWGHIK
jgi:hypothetical protein